MSGRTCYHLSSLHRGRSRLGSVCSQMSKPEIKRTSRKPAVWGFSMGCTYSPARRSYRRGRTDWSISHRITVLKSGTSWSLSHRLKEETCTAWNYYHLLCVDREDAAAPLPDVGMRNLDAQRPSRYPRCSVDFVWLAMRMYGGQGGWS